jgi:excisionase family DNA binding protein
MNALSDKKFLRPDEVAKHYNVSRSTVYGWIDMGLLKAVKVAGKTIRIPVDALKEIERPTLD